MTSKHPDRYDDPPLSDEEAALVAAESDDAQHELAAPLRALAIEEPADRNFAERVMARIEDRQTGFFQRILQRLRQPTSPRQTVLTAVPVAVVVGLVTFFLVRDAVTLADMSPSRTDAAGDLFPVDFELRAPNATRVTLSGDFNRWSHDISLSDPDGDGVWSVTVTLPRGRYAYQYRVDGEARLGDSNATETETIPQRGPSAILRL